MENIWRNSENAHGVENNNPSFIIFKHSMLLHSSSLFELKTIRVKQAAQIETDVLSCPKKTKSTFCCCP